MNTSALKSFAPDVRRQLMEAVTRKLDYVLTADTPDLRQAAKEVAALRAEAAKDRDALIDRVAYTWFNRLAALRFLDARGWHPFKARVLTPATQEETQPEILKLTRTGSLPAELQPHTDPKRLNDLLDGRIPSSDAQTEVYRHLVLAACRFYHALLPGLFEAVNDETELLLPDDLLTATSVAEGFRTEISDDDCSEVEILGWLYQFYISERKDEVMARKSAVPTEDIPAVTQLFTPHWIVRYLVENSLGRLWLLNRPGSRLREHMPYYIEGEAETDFLKITKPEDIRLCDPAVGSGHMLTYAFDLLTLIYEEEGYAPTEIPALILRHNLYGLEICPRAAQLAELALVFKAREKSRSFFQHLVRPRIIELQNVRFEEGEPSAYFKAIGSQPSALHPQLLTLLHQFEEAKNFGSLIQPCLTESEVHAIRSQIQNSTSNIQDSDLMVGATHLKVLCVLEQAESLTQRYHVVVANPPYFGPKQMNPNLREFGKEVFPDAKPDLYAMFMERGFSLALPHGFLAMVVMQSWMFLHSFEALRRKLLGTKTILSMAHLGARAFATISGEIVTVTAFVFLNAFIKAHRAEFHRLIDGNEAEKEKAFLERGNAYRDVSQDAFSQIPGSPVAYWIGDKLRSAFANQLLVPLTISDGQNKTADNGRFVRQLWELEATTVGRDRKWLLYAKGGSFRRWYGNLDSVVDWSPQARQHYRKDSNCRIVPDYLWYRPGITWSRVGTALHGFRLLPQDTTFDMVGSSVFVKENGDIPLLLGLLNTPVAQSVLELLNPSIDLQVKDVRNVPLASDVDRSTVKTLVSELLELSKSDWDNFEVSWDFCDQPLLRPGLKGATLEASWRNWEAQSTAAIRRMQELETENNRLFIAAYDLDGELQPEVPEAQITLARAEARRDMAAFLSYAVGCMMGRYSLDAPGLICANAGDTVETYVEKIASLKNSTFSIQNSTFHPDTDGIIPVLDGEWFEDDIVARTRNFLRATFGEAKLNENLRFIEESLGKSLEKYFLTDFYKDHLQTYKKRPIYWLFASPNRGFSALVYLHRYTKDTCNSLLNRYLRDFIRKLESRITHLTQAETTATSAREKTAARKESDKLRKTLKECQEWERDTLLPLAQQRIELDLDDGVITNYQKFPGLLVKIPGLEKKDED